MLAAKWVVLMVGKKERTTVARMASKKVGPKAA